MSVGLKNDLDQIDDLVGDFDFAVNEQCVQYEVSLEEMCAVGESLGLSSILKNLDLDAVIAGCVHD